MGHMGIGDKYEMGGERAGLGVWFERGVRELA